MFSNKLNFQIMFLVPTGYQTLSLRVEIPQVKLGLLLCFPTCSHISLCVSYIVHTFSMNISYLLTF